MAIRELSIAFPVADRPAMEAVRGLSLEVPTESVTAVIGPNGCGKSTLLRAVAGLLVPTSGQVTVGDEPPRPGDGRTGLVFQQPRLLPWLTVLDNVALPLALAGRGTAERRALAAAALRAVGLESVADRHPAELSGGMAQRAGLARGLVVDPPVLLLDEPFSALDALTRESFDSELQRLIAERPRTVMVVTHAVSEAVRLADQIVVLTARPGRVARVVPVDLGRPRPVSLAGNERAAAIEAEVREALSDVHPAELQPWVELAS